MAMKSRQIFNGEGKRQKAKGKRQKAKGKRQKAKGKRQKAKGKDSTGLEDYLFSVLRGVCFIRAVNQDLT
ncbi:hypothetical protein [Sulfuriferula multivorans]|uniref:hypothetical protein n=1 Tax=Sulfuriferula multivorans TaxID=1559896 RepID=UPI000F5C120E|nr:hypothetical protein [Sulfuriferula multivorans]